MDKPYDIRERSFLFSTSVLDIAAVLPRSPEADVIRTQVIRSSTSIGANVEEADGALTKPDKRKSLVVARKEARETRYWIRLISHRWEKKVPVEAQIQESTELILILSTIINKLS